MIYTLDPKKYKRHSFHDEKVNKWLIENHGAMVESTEYMGISKGEGTTFCDCYMDDEDYIFYYDKYPTCEEAASCEEEIITYLIPDLTEDEKDDLLCWENICVYLCPVCGAWGVDTD